LSSRMGISCADSIHGSSASPSCLGHRPSFAKRTDTRPCGARSTANASAQFAWVRRGAQATPAARRPRSRRP